MRHLRLKVPGYHPGGVTNSAGLHLEAYHNCPGFRLHFLVIRSNDALRMRRCSFWEEAPGFQPRLCASFSIALSFGYFFPDRPANVSMSFEISASAGSALVIRSR